MNIISLNKENLGQEHICCAIANDNDCQVAAKKAWLAQRFDDGLVFLKGDVRGKCFIELIPAEKAWAPIEAPGYMYIDCLWVSGQFKGQGYSNQLLEACVQYSRDQGKLGLVILSARKKLGFIADPSYLRYKGFILADSAPPTFELMYLPFAPDAPRPAFRQCVKTPSADLEGWVLYYSHQCPFTAKYVPVVEAIAREKGIPFKALRLESADQAQQAPCPFTAYSLFHNGEFITHEILSEKKFAKILEAAPQP